MRKTRFTEPQIMAVLRQAESGVAVPELCREHGISTASFYKWRSKYGGMDASMMSQMKVLEDENRRLKRMFADLNNPPPLKWPAVMFRKRSIRLENAAFHWPVVRVPV